MGPIGACDKRAAPNCCMVGRFCDSCGYRLLKQTNSLSSKQVTVLFAECGEFPDDRVRSGGGTLARDPIGEIVFGCAATITRSYGGTVTSVPATESWHCSVRHSRIGGSRFRACLAALAIQEQIAQLAAEVQRRDGVALLLRVA